MIGNRQLDHPVAMRFAGNPFPLFVRRNARRHKPNLIQPSLLPRLLCCDQMAEMNGIKRTAQNADTFWALDVPVPFHIQDGNTIVLFSVDSL